MEYEILRTETAEKLVNYDKLLQQRLNVIRYLKNQISMNKKDLEKYHMLKNKELMITARSRLGLAEEILKFYKEQK